jgi:hypothetical protein
VGGGGFVRVVDERTLAFPSYDGNGMFRAWGNVLDPTRTSDSVHRPRARNESRVNGRASLDAKDPLLGEFAGAELVVPGAGGAIFPNCPRRIHRICGVGGAIDSTHAGRRTPGHRSAWKSGPTLRRVPPGSAAERGSIRVTASFGSK